MNRPRARLGLAVTAVAGLAVVAACSRSAAAPTMASALEAVPLRLRGGQTVEVQLAARQPATGACDPLPAAERVRIRDGDLTVTVPEAEPVAATGTVRVVPGTPARFVVATDGRATAWLDGTLATGPEVDVARFVGVDLGVTSPVASVRAVTWLARALDDAGASAAVLRGPGGPPDGTGAWTAAGATPDGRLLRLRATGSGVQERTLTPAGDPCAYRQLG